jgi:hypothetical protein
LFGSGETPIKIGARSKIESEKKKREKKTKKKEKETSIYPTGAKAGFLRFICYSLASLSELSVHISACGERKKVSREKRLANLWGI